MNCRRIGPARGGHSAETVRNGGPIRQAQGEGIVHDVAMRLATGSRLAQDGEGLAHSICQRARISSADLTANRGRRQIGVRLANGAFLKQHKGNAAVHDDAQLLLASSRKVAHLGEGQLGGENKIRKGNTAVGKAEQRVDRHAVVNVQAEIAV